MQDDVLATIQASPSRRWAGVGTLCIVGALVSYAALATPPQLGWQVFMLAGGATAFWLAHRMWIATQDGIELTRSHLRSRSGRIICEIADIETVDSGAFAFKPSNGFVVLARTPGQNRWEPGMWWRIGRRIGIGGMTAAAEAKVMSDMLKMLLMERPEAR